MPSDRVDTVIRGGTLVTQDQTIEGSLAIDDGAIVARGSRDALPNAEETIDAAGKLVLPGAVDPHVHANDSITGDTYRTATRAAALGGVTTVIPFAWSDRNEKDRSDSFLDAIADCKSAADEAIIDYSVHGTILREDPEALEALEDAIAEGVTSMKLFTTYDFGVSNGFVNRALRRFADLGIVGLFHTEDDSVCQHLSEQLKTDEKGSATSYPQSRPDYAEAMALDDALRMARETGAKYYGVHTTSRKAAEVLDRYRVDGRFVRGETCTHYTVFDDSIYEERGTLATVAPPFRKPDDIDALFEALRNGTLSVVSTDHCGFTREDKTVDRWWDGEFGVNSLQRSLEVFHQVAVVERGFSYPEFVRLLCTVPARTFGLPGKGTLEPGTDADIVVFDPNRTRTISASNNVSIADFSLYEGMEVTGRVEKTMVRGELVADDGELVAAPGHGEFIERDLPDWDR